MRKRIITSGLLVCVLLARVQAQEKTSAPTLGSAAPTLAYASIEDFVHIPPEANFGEVAAVTLDQREHLYVFNRGPRHLVEFDAAGRYVRQLAQGLITHPHGLRSDSEGYLWLVDDMDHHVIKLDTRGRVVMVLGRRGLAGESETLFNRPTDVAVNSRATSTSRTAMSTLGW